MSDYSSTTISTIPGYGLSLSDAKRNRKTITPIIDEFIAIKKSEKYSPRTINSYGDIFRVFLSYLNCDMAMEEISVSVIRDFFTSPGMARLTRKTAMNYHSALSMLWKWAIDNQYCYVNVIRCALRIRRDPPKEIRPFTKDDLILLLEEARKTRTRRRDEAIVLLLIDTGLRASELCNIRVKDVYWKSRKIVVTGKGNKERTIKCSERTCEALMENLRFRGIYYYTSDKPITLNIIKEVKEINLTMIKDEPLFLAVGTHPIHMTRGTLRKLLFRLGWKSGVVGVHAHRFRHTFAIQFIRNGGNIYTLQKLLGHNSLEMCRRYLAVSQIDMDESLDKASPVKVWNL
jgi:site-specific recombinase XerD